MQPHLVDRERYMLEVLDALGGNATVGQIRSVASPFLNRNLHPILAKLCEHGFVRQYARNHYALLPSGRTTLKAPTTVNCP
jgi:hypothetical protein